MKKSVLFLLVFVLLIGAVQVALAEPDPPQDPPTAGSCNMVASWWDPDAGDSGPGNANGVQPGERGMYHVHNRDHPSGYTNGATNMDKITTEHCG